MDAKKIALLIGALIVAGLTAFMAKTMFDGSSAPQVQAAVMPKETGPEVLVATRPLPLGTIITPDAFRFQPWPKDLIQNAYYIKGEADPATLAGTVVRAPISAGQPVTMGQLVQPDDRGFLAAALGPGMRAITIQLQGPSNGVAGFIFPGDRVDVVLTQAVDGDEGPSLKVSETIIRNVRVLATDQRTVPEDEEGKRAVAIYSMVTLETTPKIAEKIAVAQSIGNLSLSLRSLADNTAELERAIASGAVSVPANGDPKAEKNMMLAVASRPIDTDTTFVTGADVSRFQRRSVPTKASARPAPTPSYAPSYRGGQQVPSGPVVRIARGNNVTEVPVGGK